jgi:hypothetical protein
VGAEEEEEEEEETPSSMRILPEHFIASIHHPACRNNRV